VASNVRHYLRNFAFATISKPLVRHVKPTCIMCNFGVFPREDMNSKLIRRRIRRDSVASHELVLFHKTHMHPRRRVPVVRLAGSILLIGFLAAEAAFEACERAMFTRRHGICEGAPRGELSTRSVRPSSRSC
jgi:hypothetical protein